MGIGIIIALKLLDRLTRAVNECEQIKAHHCQAAQPSARVQSTGDHAEAFTYFWELVEAQSADDLDYLWPDFDRRSRELAALARAEDIKITLYHLTRAANESPLLARWEHAMHRAAILEAISAAAVVS
jgi:hypothetical protein